MTRRVGLSARRIFGAVSAVAMLAVVSGCGLLGGSEEKPTNAPAAPGKVEKAKIKRRPAHHPRRRVGPRRDQEGLLQGGGARGRTVKIIQGGAAAIPGLISGELDFTFGNWVSFFAAQAKEAAKDVDGLKLVTDGYQAKPEMFLILAKAGIRHQVAARTSRARPSRSTRSRTSPSSPRRPRWRPTTSTRQR